MSLIKQIAKASSLGSSPARKSFSLTSLSGLRSNVISGANSSGRNGIIKIPTRDLSSWIGIMGELESYELYMLIQNIIKLLRDYVVAQIDTKTKSYVTIPNDDKLTKKCNKFISRTRYFKTFYQDLDEIIYYGGKAHGLDKPDDKSKIVITDLREPFKVIIHTSRNKYDLQRLNNGSTPRTHERKVKLLDKHIAEYLVYQGTSPIAVSPKEMLVFGVMDFRLKVADSRHHYEDLTGDRLLVDSEAFYAFKSPFYSLTSKIKEYVVKETLASILGIKELLMPMMLRLGVDLTRATDTSEINKTVNEIESKINDAVDASLLAGDVLNIDEILQSMFSTVRLIPDPGNMLTNMDELNMQAIKDKFDTVMQDKKEVEDSILENLGIPSDLFDGGSNQYEVLTRSQRYETTVFACLNSLQITFQDNFLKLCKLSKEFDEKELLAIQNEAKYSLFKVSSIELNRMTTQITQQQELARSLSDLVESYSGLIKDNPYVVPDKALDSLKINLGSISTDLSAMIVDELPSDEVIDDSEFKGPSYFSRGNATK